MVYYFFIYVIKADSKSALNKLFAIMCLCLAISSFAHIFILQNDSINVSSFWKRLSSIGDFNIRGIALNFVMVLTKKEKLLKKKWMYFAIYIPGLFQMVVKLVFPDENSITPLILHMSFVNSIIVKDIIISIVIFAFLIHYRNRCLLKREKKQVNVILIPTIIGEVIILAYLNIGAYYGLSHTFDMVHVLILISTFGMWISIVKYKFLTLQTLITAEDILGKVKDLIILVDPTGRIINVNKRVHELLGYSEKELIGKKLNEFTDSGLEIIEPPDSSQSIYNSNSTDVQFKTKSGWYIPVNMYYSPIIDSFGDTAGIAFIAQDASAFRQLQEEIFERKQTQERLEFINIHDQLTGLYNRNFFEQELHRLYTGNYYPFGLIMSDVDGLKLVNDTLVHDTGDKLIITVADTISKACSTNNVIARIGGDEFAILVTYSNETCMSDIIRSIRKEVKYYNSENTDFHLSISLGYAMAKDASKSMKNLFKEADNNNSIVLL